MRIKLAGTAVTNVVAISAVDACERWLLQLQVSGKNAAYLSVAIHRSITSRRGQLDCQGHEPAFPRQQCVRRELLQNTAADLLIVDKPLKREKS